MSRIFSHIANLVVDRPSWILAGLILFTGLSTVGYLNPDPVRNFLRPPTTETPVSADVAGSQQSTPDVDPVSLTDSDAVIVVRSDSFFTPQGAAALRHIVSELEALDYVSRILWMDRVPILNIFGLPEPLLPPHGPLDI